MKPLDVLRSVSRSKPYRRGTKSETYLLDAVLHEIPDDLDLSLLANAMDTVHRMCLDHEIPMRLDDVHLGGDAQIHASSKVRILVEG